MLSTRNSLIPYREPKNSATVHEHMQAHIYGWAQIGPTGLRYPESQPSQVISSDMQ